MISLRGILKGLRIQDAVDRTKQFVIQVDSSATPGTTTTLVAAQTADRTIILPDGGSFVTPSSVDTFTNKSIDGDTNTLTDISISSLKAVPADALKVLSRDVSGVVVSTTIPGLTSVFLDGDFTLQNTADHTKQFKISAASVTSGSTATATWPGGNDTILGSLNTQNVFNKTLDSSNRADLLDNKFTLSNFSDNSKLASFDLSTLSSGIPVSLGLPNISTTLVGASSTQTLSNKTFSDAIILTQISTPSNPSASHNKVYVKSDGLLYLLDSSGVESTISKAPTKTILTSTGTSAGFVFVITTGSATTGATYTNNGQTFTVVSTIASANTLFMTGTGSPTASGTLTKSAGTGDASITFSKSEVTATYTPPSGCKLLKVTAVGGGAGGGSAGNIVGANASAGGGGGGGATAIKYLSAPLESLYYYRVSNSTAAAVTAGANTYFMPMIAGGGFAGATGSTSGAAVVTAVSRGGGVARDADILIPGGQGGSGFVSSGTLAIGGVGGSSTFTGSAQEASGTSAGNAGGGFGGGGGGSSALGVNTSVGGTGSQGVIIIEEYY